MRAKAHIQGRASSRVLMALVFLFLYAPILLLIVFSFNKGNSNIVWTGFSLDWYKSLFQNRLIMRSVYTTLLVSLLATVIATFAGTFAAIGFYNLRRRQRTVLNTVNNIPMMNADIVTGVAMCLSFVAFFSFWSRFAVWFNGLQNMITLPSRLTLGFGTLLIAHITFNIPYVILSVSPKLRQMDKSGGRGPGPWLHLDAGLLESNSAGDQARHCLRRTDRLYHERG